MYENELAHYGTLGMKWGVRRSKEARSAKTKRDRRYDAQKLNTVSTRFGRITNKNRFNKINKEYSNQYLKNKETYKKELSIARDAAAKRLYGKKYSEILKESGRKIKQGAHEVGRILAGVGMTTNSNRLFLGGVRLAELTKDR